MFRKIQNTFMDLDHIKGEIIKFKDDDSSSLTIFDELTRTQRSDIHEFVKQLGLFSKSFNKSGSTVKYMIISKLPSESDIFEIDSTFIELFSSLSRIPIPVPLPDYVDYYLNLTDKYFDTLRQFNMFKSDVIKFGGLSKFKTLIDNICMK